jgi:hypothetical protein
MCSVFDSSVCNRVRARAPPVTGDRTRSFACTCTRSLLFPWSVRSLVLTPECRHRDARTLVGATETSKEASTSLFSHWNVRLSG